MTTPPPAALRAAEKITREIEDAIHEPLASLSTEAFARLITSEYAPMVEALADALIVSRHYVYDLGHLEQIDKALQLLKETK